MHLEGANLIPAADGEDYLAMTVRALAEVRIPRKATVPLGLGFNAN